MWKLNWNDWTKIAEHALIAGAGAALYYLAQHAAQIDPTLGPVVAAVAGVLVKVVKQFASDSEGP